MCTSKAYNAAHVSQLAAIFEDFRIQNRISNDDCRSADFALYSYHIIISLFATCSAFTCYLYHCCFICNFIIAVPFVTSSKHMQYN